MSRKWAPLPRGDGTAQEGRLPKALERGYFFPQERALHDHMSILVGYANQVGLPDDDGIPKGNWAPLFSNEPAFLLAQVVALRCDERRLAFRTALDRSPDAGLTALHDLAEHLRTLQDGLRRHGYDALLSQMDLLGRDAFLRENLAPELAAGEQSTPARGLHGGILDQLAKLKSEGGSPGAQGLAIAQTLQRLARSDGLAADSAVHRAAAARNGLEDGFELLLNVFRLIRPDASRALQARLSSGLIDPALGLLISQLQLLSEAETRMNGFVDRHTQFYYREVLGQAPRPADPETLLLRLSPAGAPVYVDGGVQVVGRAEGQTGECRYRLHDGLRVVPAEIGAGRTLVYLRDPKISRQQQLGYVTAIRARSLDAANLGARSLFAPEQLEDVPVGIDVSSNILALAEGRREITVDLGMRLRSPFAMPRVDDLADKMSRGHDAVLAAGPGAKGEGGKHGADIQPVIAAVVAGLAADPALAAAFSLGSEVEAIARALIEIGAPEQKAEKKALSDAKKAGDKPPQPKDYRGVFWHACLLHADTGDKVRALYGRIVLETLVEGLDWPDGDLRALLLERIDQYLVPKHQEPDLQDGAAPRIFQGGAIDDDELWLKIPPEEIFQKFLGGGFTTALSVDNGFFEPRSVRIVPIRTVPLIATPGAFRQAGPEGQSKKLKSAQGADKPPVGIRLHLTVERSAPAIVPPPGGRAPVLQIRMAGGARYCPYSLFEPYALEYVSLKVQVSGLKKLSGFSEDGPIDPSRAFMPFGARPRHGASFQIGAPELASKAVTSVGVGIDWADVPAGAGGFASHYAGYGADFPLPDPVLHISYLAMDGWRALKSKPVQMLPTPDGGNTMSPRLDVFAEVPGQPVVATLGTQPADFRQLQTVGAGLVQCVLDCPDPVFGHSTYPTALAAAMRPNLNPFRKRPMPREPYTPKIAAIRLDYTAEEKMVMAAPFVARADQSVTRIEPFGQREVFPDRPDADAGLFLPRLANGSLFFRLDGAVTKGEVTFAFVMTEASHQRVSFPPAQVRWHYMTKRGWSLLPSSAVEADTTEGFMRSGVVRINIPQEAVTHSPQMPGEGLWLCLSADERLMAFPSLRRAAVNGVVVTRANMPPDGGPGGLPDSWYLEPAPAGIAGIERLSQPLGGRPPEARTAFRTRVGEHLRHRKRGVTPWDIERLVLDAFPQVWKCKCFSATEWRRRTDVPGSVSVVVVPFAPEDALANPAQPRMLDVLTLQHIETMLRDHCGPFAQFEVNNPSFERLQVRATVGFPRNKDEVALAQQLKLDLSRFLSVWTAPPPLNGFGWSVNVNDVGAFMLGLEYVESFSGLSLLQLVQQDNGTYRLIDTALARDVAGARRGGEVTDSTAITSQKPWALAMPTAEHWIQVAADPGGRKSQVTGIGGLAVGQMLVIDKERL